MSLKASATSRCSVAPVTSARASSSPSSTRRAVRARRSQRPRERAGEDPREREAERERDQPDADEHEDVPAHPVVDGLHALGHSHGPDPAPVVEHRHGRVEQLLAERLARARPLRGAPGERRLDLGPARVRRRRRATRGVREQPAARVDDDHPRAEVVGRRSRPHAAAGRARRCRAAAAAATICACADACARTSASTRLERLNASGISSAIRTSTSTYANAASSRRRRLR